MKKLLWVFLIIPFICYAFTTNAKSIEEPTAESIFKKNLSVVLGSTKIESIKDIVLVGTGNLMGQPTEMIFKYILNNHFSLKLNLGTIGTVMEQGKVGDEYIAKQQGNTLPIDEKMKESLNESVYYFTEQLILENNKYTYKLIGSETIDGADCYNIELTSPSKSVSNLYYDKATGLKLRVVATSEDGKTNIINYSDYTTISGIQFPNKMSIDPGQGFTLDLEFKNIKVNSNLTIADLK